MSDEAPLLGEARELIRSGQRAEAIKRLTDHLGDLDAANRKKAHTLIGLAFYFDAQYPEAFTWFTVAADGNEVPEDWFNVAMAQVKMGVPAAGEDTWKKVFDLSYAHQDAAETSTFFMKKQLFAEALAGAGACGPLGLDLLERQLLPFFTHYRVTDPSFWGIRGVPDYYSVMDLLLVYYRALGKSKADWEGLCERVKAGVDEDGQAYADKLRGQWDATPPVKAAQ